MNADQRERQGPWDLRLYVSNHTPRSVAAFENLKRICEKHLCGRYRIEVVDLLEQPQLAKQEQIVAIPTVVRHCPLPACRVVGDLSDAEKTLRGLHFCTPI